MTEISVRDYFAAQALPAVLAAVVAHEGEWDDRVVAQACYALADALLAARAGHAGAPPADVVPDGVRTTKGGLELDT